MTTQAQPTHLLDQLLSEIEAGRAAEAIWMLSGMLDASLSKDNGGHSWRSSLLGHPLFQLLSNNLNKLSVANAFRSPAHAAKSVNRITPDSFSNLGFVRALEARRSLSQQTVTEAWRLGKQIALVDCGEQGELDALRARDLANIIVAHHSAIARDGLRSRHGDTLAIYAAGCFQTGLHSQYDLILANNIADGLQTDALLSACKGFATQLKPGGRIVLSAFAPGHLGQGLQQLCVNPDLVCHAEPALEAIASAAGLTISHFRDSSNSLIWVELRAAIANRPTKGAVT